MSKFVPEDKTSPFAQTDSSSGEPMCAPFNTLLYRNPLSQIVYEKKATWSSARGKSRGRGERNDEKKLVDVVGGMPAGVRSAADYESFTFSDELR